MQVRKKLPLRGEQEGWYGAGLSPGSKTAYLTSETGLWLLQKPNVSLAWLYTTPDLCIIILPGLNQRLGAERLPSSVRQQNDRKTEQTGSVNCRSYRPDSSGEKYRAHYIGTGRRQNSLFASATEIAKSWSEDLFQGTGSLLRSSSAPFDFSLKGFLLRVIYLTVQKENDIAAESLRPSPSAIPVPRTRSPPEL